MPTETYVALGSNLKQPWRQIDRAIDAIATLPGTRIQKTAPRYRSLAIGPIPQPEFINTVICVETRLSPATLLRKLQSIENRLGRRRCLRWGPRTIDLDLLLYDQYIFSNRTLTLPHPRMLERNFVLYPLADIAPHLKLPCGKYLPEVLANCNPDGIVRFDAGETRGSTR